MTNRATLVQAPRVTVFNTQRSHVMFLTQLAYIQDYEPQVSTLAANSGWRVVRIREDLQSIPRTIVLAPSTAQG